MDFYETVYIHRRYAVAKVQHFRLQLGRLCRYTEGRVHTVIQYRSTFVVNRGVPKSAKLTLKSCDLIACKKPNNFSRYHEYFVNLNTSEAAQSG